MGTRKTLIKSQAGVKLQRIEHLAGQQKVVQSSWRLSTLRANQPRAFADEAEAEDAFDMEVIAALRSPHHRYAAPRVARLTWRRS